MTQLLQMERPYFRAGDGGGFKPKFLPQTLAVRPLLSSTAEYTERERYLAAMETTLLKAKIKQRLSEGVRGAPPISRPALPSIRAVHPTPADCHYATEPAATISPSLHRAPISLETSAGLNKPVSRLTLPSIRTVSRDTTNLYQPSACPVPATFPECIEEDSYPGNGGPVSHPMSHPEQGMIEALKCLNHKDWDKKQKGLISVSCLASWHPDVLISKLHLICVAVTREVSNLRSKVACQAMQTLGDLFRALKKDMDQEVDDITQVLLQKIGGCNNFLREESDNCLSLMVAAVSPAKALSALIAGGSSHRNSSIRKHMAKHLLAVVEKLGADKLLSGPREKTDTFLQTLVKLVHDGQQDTRFYGRRIFTNIMDHHKFTANIERVIPPHDLRVLMATITLRAKSDCVEYLPSGRPQQLIQRNPAVLMAKEACTRGTASTSNKFRSKHVEPESLLPLRRIIPLGRRQI